MYADFAQTMRATAPLASMTSQWEKEIPWYVCHNSSGTGKVRFRCATRRALLRDHGVRLLIDPLASQDLVR